MNGSIQVVFMIVAVTRGVYGSWLKGLWAFGSDVGTTDFLFEYD